MTATPAGGRLAVIGAGPSGLISLKCAIQELPDWDIVCYEKSGEATGSWGNPGEDFISTSTKCTTQFAGYKKYSASFNSNKPFEEFFRGDEYGRYLEEFAEKYDLLRHITFHSDALSVTPHVDGTWKVVVRINERLETEIFSHVIIATGLAADPKKITQFSELSSQPQEPASSEIANKTVVVIGGGESAVDTANKLSNPELKNKVYLSLRSGIRVSPRYHPIRGVPSDYLRNRLLLSIHEDIRNRIGQKFVELRIGYTEAFAAIFPGRKTNSHNGLNRQLRKHWDIKLTKKAKDSLFNTFHNKSEDFLDSVARGNLTIIGPPAGEGFTKYYDFDREQELTVNPDVIVEAIGYRSVLGNLTDGAFKVNDFYLGCLHPRFESLFLVGFARPIIGSIPPISEMQARYVVGLMSRKYKRPANIEALHKEEQEDLLSRYPTIDTREIRPVEMIPYCDHLAELMRAYPSRARVGSLRRWLRIMLSPSSTLHYLTEDFDADYIDRQPIYTPMILTALLALVKFFDIPYRKIRSGSKTTKAGNQNNDR